MEIIVQGLKEIMYHHITIESFSLNTSDKEPKRKDNGGHEETTIREILLACEIKIEVDAPVARSRDGITVMLP